MKCVCTPTLPSDTNIYQYVPYALQHTYSSCMATFLPRRNTCHDLSTDPHIFIYYDITNITGDLITTAYLWPL
jgi:hypothetical protein